MRLNSRASLSRSDGTTRVLPSASSTRRISSLDENLASGDGAQFHPDLMEGRRRLGANQPAQATVKNVRSAMPGRAQSAGEQARFQNLGLDAVHLQVTTAGKTGNAGADDDDFFTSLNLSRERRHPCRRVDCGGRGPACRQDAGAPGYLFGRPWRGARLVCDVHHFSSH